jgi:hypothetical protein
VGWKGRFGFELPSVVPAVPRIDLKQAMQNVGKRVVRAERFELPTFWFVARRSIQLSYARMRTSKDYQKGPKTPSFVPPAAFLASKFFDGTPLLVRTDFHFAGQFRG